MTRTEQKQILDISILILIIVFLIFAMLAMEGVI